MTQSAIWLGVGVLPQASGERLSRISTQWSLIYQSQWGSSDAAAAAQCEFVSRYCGAIYRYLAGALHNEDAAEELFQEFALRFVRGDFRRADPNRGRFRDYLKSILSHLITDYYRRRAAEPKRLPEDHPESSRHSADAAEPEDDFEVSWREELINQAWTALESANAGFYQVLRWHAEHPELSAGEIATQLSAGRESPTTAGNIRVTLHRAREKFAELLVAVVAHSLGEPTREELCQELRDLRLWSLCESAFTRWQAG